jgi:hypothetical protein
MLFWVLVNYCDLVKNAIFMGLKKCFTHIFYESEERKLSKESRRWWKIFYCYYEHGVIFYHLLNIKEDRGRFQNKIHSENEAINAIKLVLTRWQGFFFLVWVFYICEDYPWQFLCHFMHAMLEYVVKLSRLCSSGDLQQKWKWVGED